MIMIAAADNNVDCVKLLLDRGANVNAVVQVQAHMARPVWVAEFF